MDVLLDQVAEFRQSRLFDAADDTATQQRCDIFFEYPTILAIIDFRMAKNSNCRRFFVSDLTIEDFAVTKHQFKTLSIFRSPIHHEKIVGNSKKMAEILSKMRKSSDIRIFCHNCGLDKRRRFREPR